MVQLKFTAVLIPLTNLKTQTHVHFNYSSRRPIITHILEPILGESSEQCSHPSLKDWYPT